MAQIEVVRDPNIEHEEIVIQLQQDSANNTNDEYSPTMIQQTKVYGIIVPIIALNGIVVSFDDLIEFELNDSQRLPTVKFKFHDRENIFARYVDSGAENRLQVQILPPADDMYKKINIEFFVTKIGVHDSVVEGEGEYMLPAFRDTQWKAFGQISTYELFDKVSVETKLGLATNIEATEDKRYMNCAYESYFDVIEREIKKSDSNDVQVLDWWVDLWDNLVLCNIYDRVNSVDTEEEMLVWMSSNKLNVSDGQEGDYVQIPALYTNMPMVESSSLHIKGLTPINNPVSQSIGNTKSISCYEENKQEYISHCVLDGDIKDNVFTQYEYAGEVYGDYNYLLAEQCRELYINKIYSETVVIRTDMPQICLNRGSQVRVVWYDNSGESQLEDNNLEGLMTSKDDVLTQMGWLKDFVPPNTDDEIMPMNISLMYSGQYTILGQIIRFDGNYKTWDCYLRLTRPRYMKPQLLITDTKENGNK